MTTNARRAQGYTTTDTTTDYLLGMVYASGMGVFATLISYLF